MVKENPKESETDFETKYFYPVEAINNFYCNFVPFA